MREFFNVLAAHPLAATFLIIAIMLTIETICDTIVKIVKR